MTTRCCDGTDPNLTRQVPLTDLRAKMTPSPWKPLADTGMAVVNCDCGLVFDDAERLTVYPHRRVAGPPAVRAPTSEWDVRPRTSGTGLILIRDGLPAGVISWAGAARLINRLLSAAGPVTAGIDDSVIPPGAERPSAWQRAVRFMIGLPVPAVRAAIAEEQKAARKHLLSRDDGEDAP